MGTTKRLLEIESEKSICRKVTKVIGNVDAGGASSGFWSRPGVKGKARLETSEAGLDPLVVPATPEVQRIYEHTERWNEHVRWWIRKIFGLPNDKPRKPWISNQTWTVLKWMPPCRRMLCGVSVKIRITTAGHRMARVEFTVTECFSPEKMCGWMLRENKFSDGTGNAAEDEAAGSALVPGN